MAPCDVRGAAGLKLPMDFLLPPSFVCHAQDRRSFFQWWLTLLRTLSLTARSPFVCVPACWLAFRPTQLVAIHVLFPSGGGN